MQKEQESYGASVEDAKGMYRKGKESESRGWWAILIDKDALRWEGKRETKELQLVAYLSTSFL